MVLVKTMNNRTSISAIRGLVQVGNLQAGSMMGRRNWRGLMIEILMVFTSKGDISY